MEAERGGGKTLRTAIVNKIKKGGEGMRIFLEKVNSDLMRKYNVS